MSNYSEIAKKAVVSVLGEENTYIQKILTEQLTEDRGIYEPYQFPLKESQRIKIIIEKTGDTAGDVADNITTDTDDDTVHDHDNSSDNKLVSIWIIHSLMKNLVKKDDESKSLKIWKIVNGTLAAVLPFVSAIIVGVIEYYVVVNSHNCS